MKRPQSLHESLPGLGRVFVHFWPYLRRQRILIGGSLLALLAEIGLRVLEPWPLKFIFDQLLGRRHRGRLAALGALEALDPFTLLTVAAVAIVAITGLRALADYLNTVGFAVVGNRVVTQVRADLY